NFVGPNGNDGGINGIRPTANPGITNPQVLIGVNGATGDVDVVDRPPVGGIPTRSSNPVTFITLGDVDFSGTKGISHKLFVHASYASSCFTIYIPFVGIGAEIEFARNNFS